MNSNARQLLTERDFMTCAGTETYLLFQQQFPLREFCAFEIFENEAELAKLETQYLYPLFDALAAHGQGILVDALVWRAHPDFVAALGYRPSDVERLNRQAVARTRDAISIWRSRAGADHLPMLVAADIGPRGDGYRVDDSPSVAAARDYHRAQFSALADSGVDVVCALTMTNANEAIGISQAAAELDIPIIISATAETDGSLPDGTSLADFIRSVDDATNALPLYYMINCAHPTHVGPVLEAAKQRDEPWLARLKGFRANCSKKSHEELDNSTELDRGNPKELAAELAGMKQAYDLRILGGCCGTNVEHITEIATAAA